MIYTGSFYARNKAISVKKLSRQDPGPAAAAAAAAKVTVLLS
jgi:hypothetical protein